MSSEKLAELTDESRDQYLELLGISKTDVQSPNLKSLRLLTCQQIKCIPYQNFRMHGVRQRNQQSTVKKIVNLDTNILFERIVVNKSGGFCFEVSQLFHKLLDKLGYNVIRVKSMAIVHGEPPSNMPANHNILIVDLDSKQYIVDVGFGPRSLRYPLLLDPTNKAGSTFTETEHYRVTTSSDNYIVELKRNINDKKWNPIYRFNKPFKHYNILKHCQVIADTFQDVDECPIGDKVVVLAKYTEKSRNGFVILLHPPSLKIEKAFRTHPTPKEYTNVHSLAKDVKELVGVDCPDHFIELNKNWKKISEKSKYYSMAGLVIIFALVVFYLIRLYVSV